MFRAPLCPSSGAPEYYTVGCRLWSLVLGFQVIGMVLKVCGLLQQPANLQHNLQRHTIVLTMMHGQNHFKFTSISLLWH
jgi:hypothetical protein